MQQVKKNKSLKKHYMCSTNKKKKKKWKRKKAAIFDAFISVVINFSLILIIKSENWCTKSFSDESKRKLFSIDRAWTFYYHYFYWHHWYDQFIGIRTIRSYGMYMNKLDPTYKEKRTYSCKHHTYMYTCTVHTLVIRCSLARIQSATQIFRILLT